MTPAVAGSAQARHQVVPTPTANRISLSVAGGQIDTTTGRQSRLGRLWRRCHRERSGWLVKQFTSPPPHSSSRGPRDMWPGMTCIRCSPARANRLRRPRERAGRRFVPLMRGAASSSSSTSVDRRYRADELFIAGGNSEQGAGHVLGGSPSPDALARGVLGGRRLLAPGDVAAGKPFAGVAIDDQPPPVGDAVTARLHSRVALRRGRRRRDHHDGVEIGKAGAAASMRGRAVDPPCRDGTIEASRPGYSMHSTRVSSIARAQLHGPATR